MKWLSTVHFKPKHGSKIFLWNKKYHRKEIFNAFWDENSWDGSNFPEEYEKIWCYVFDDIEPIKIEVL